MPRTRPPYPPEFRLEAVRLLRAGAVAEAAGGGAGLFGADVDNWLRQDQADRGERQDVLSSGAAVARAGARKQGAASGAGDPEAGSAFFARETDRP